MNSGNIKEEGILRLSGGKQRIEAFIQEFDEGKEVVFDKVDPHVVSGVLKQFFRDLAEPIIPPRINEQVLKVLGKTKKNQKSNNQFLWKIHF